MIVELLLALSLSQGLTTLAPGQKSSGAKAPLITPDANVVAHIWFPKAITDTKGNAWAAEGAPPVTLSTLFKVKRYGTGPTTTTDYWKLGTGSDALDTAGDFTLCAVFTGPPGTAIRAIFTNGTVVASAGFAVQFSAAEFGSLETYGVGATATATGAVPAVGAGANITCVGRAGTDQFVKTNGGTTATNAGAKTVACDAATAACTAFIGYNSRNTLVFPGLIFEVYMTATAWDEGAVAAIQAAVLAQVK